MIDQTLSPQKIELKILDLQTDKCQLLTDVATHVINNDQMVILKKTNIDLKIEAYQILLEKKNCKNNVIKTSWKIHKDVVNGNSHFLCIFSNLVIKILTPLKCKKCCNNNNKELYSKLIEDALNKDRIYPEPLRINPQNEI